MEIENQLNILDDRVFIRPNKIIIPKICFTNIDLTIIGGYYKSFKLRGYITSVTIRNNQIIITNIKGQNIHIINANPQCEDFKKYLINEIFDQIECFSTPSNTLTILICILDNNGNTKHDVTFTTNEDFAIYIDTDN